MLEALELKVKAILSFYKEVTFRNVGLELTECDEMIFELNEECKLFNIKFPSIEEKVTDVQYLVETVDFFMECVMDDVHNIMTANKPVYVVDKYIEMAETLINSDSNRKSEIDFSLIEALIEPYMMIRSGGLSFSL